MESMKESSLNEIQEKIKSVLEVDEVPAFEVNEQTIPLLCELLKDYENRKMKDNIVAQQMQHETEEFIADSKDSFSESRMNKVLVSLDLDPLHGLSPKVKKYVKSLSTAMDALGVVNASLPMLVVAVTELQDDISKSWMQKEKLEELCARLQEESSEVRNLLDLFHKQYEDLESQLHKEQKNVEALNKSNRFHSQKRKQYESRASQSERSLRASGFSSKFSHTEIVELGKRAAALEADLRPRLIELQSYKQLPPDSNLARLKLCEVMKELKQTEDELHDVFQNISLSS